MKRFAALLFITVFTSPLIAASKPDLTRAWWMAVPSERACNDGSFETFTTGRTGAQFIAVYRGDLESSEPPQKEPTPYKVIVYASLLDAIVPFQKFTVQRHDAWLRAMPDGSAFIVVSREPRPN